MQELKPCPFCGGEADAVRSSVAGVCAVVCNCASHVFYDAEVDMGKTIDAWNTRAERTCIAEENSDASYGDCMYVCSECGADFDNDEFPNYCPNCGARVVEE